MNRAGNKANKAALQAANFSMDLQNLFSVSDLHYLIMYIVRSSLSNHVCLISM